MERKLCNNAVPATHGYPSGRKLSAQTQPLGLHRQNLRPKISRQLLMLDAKRK